MHRGAERQTGGGTYFPTQELDSLGTPLLLTSGVPGQENESCAPPQPWAFDQAAPTGSLLAGTTPASPSAALGSDGVKQDSKGQGEE